MLFSPFGIAFRSIILIVGILLLHAGLKALRKAKAESFDAESYRVNLYAALIMAAVGLAMTVYMISWIYARLRRVFT